MESKVCSKCKEEKPFTEYRKSKDLPNGIRPECKECAKLIERDYRERNKEKLKIYNREYRQSNLEKLKSQKQIYYINNKPNILERVSNYNKANPEGAKIRLNKFKLLHAERYKQQKKKWTLNNPEKLKEIYKRRYKTEGHEIRERNKIWHRKNKAKFSSYCHNYISRKEGNGGSHTPQEWDNLKTKYSNTCLRCGRKEPQIKLTKDHIMPIKWGGRNDISNLQTLCLPCNQSKNGKYADYRPDSKAYGEGWKKPSLWV